MTLFLWKDKNDHHFDKTRMDENCKSMQKHKSKISLRMMIGIWKKKKGTTQNKKE